MEPHGWPRGVTKPTSRQPKMSSPPGFSKCWKSPAFHQTSPKSLLQAWFRATLGRPAPLQCLFKVETNFLTGNSKHGIKVDYNPINSVGADRIANAIAGLSRYKPPFIVVDFGTATTFDVINPEGVYVGGAIMAGPITAIQALVSRGAKLPMVDLSAPESAIGKDTTHSIQSGVMFGYAGAIDALVARISKELGVAPKVIATGGLGKVFLGLCESIESYDEMLTLDGIRLFATNGD